MKYALQFVQLGLNAEAAALSPEAELAIYAGQQAIWAAFTFAILIPCSWMLWSYAKQLKLQGEQQTANHEQLLRQQKLLD